MLRDGDRARSLGRAGRRLILERFTLERTARDLAELYRNLASGAARRRKFYNPLVSLWRLALLAPLTARLGLRLLVTDLLPTVREPARGVAVAGGSAAWRLPSRRDEAGTTR
jgi:hypothetical protein